MNARGDTAACRAAAITSSAGASLGTNAEAPASRAPKSCSSPAYMVSTTMPESSALPSRTAADEVEAAAVGQPDVDDDDVGRELRSASQRLGDGAGLADDGRSRAALEGPPQTLADQLVVVDQQHRVERGLVHACS